MKLKILPLSMRLRKRYIGFELLAEGKVELSDLENAIVQTALQVYGEKGLADLRMKFLKDTWNGRFGIIKCAHTKTEDVVFLLGLIDRIGDIRTNFKIIKISGTIKKIKTFFANNQ